MSNQKFFRSHDEKYLAMQGMRSWEASRIMRNQLTDLAVELGELVQCSRELREFARGLQNRSLTDDILVYVNTLDERLGNARRTLEKIRDGEV